MAPTLTIGRPNRLRGLHRGTPPAPTARELMRLLWLSLWRPAVFDATQEIPGSKPAVPAVSARAGCGPPALQLSSAAHLRDSETAGYDRRSIVRAGILPYNSLNARWRANFVWIRKPP